MKSAIEELFLFNHKYEENMELDEEYWKNNRAVSEIFDKIKPFLDNDNKDILEDLFTAMGGCEFVQVKTGYLEGFKLGMRLAIEALT